MRIFGLIGYPLSHSFSKKYFTAKFEKEKISDCLYENYPIQSIDELEKILSIEGLSGLNVTIPYKERIISSLHYSSIIVNKIKACNCIKISDGKLYGFNSDVAGFEKSFRLKWDQSRHKKALILGTGGSSKAIKFVLEKLLIPFTVVSRKPSAGSLSYEQLTKEIMQAFQVIINTTPLGMFPNIVEAPPIPYEGITTDHFLFDLIYNPGETLFLKKGEEMGAMIQNGYDMLVFQAEENWKIWNEATDTANL